MFALTLPCNLVLNVQDLGGLDGVNRLNVEPCTGYSPLEVTGEVYPQYSVLMEPCTGYSPLEVTGEVYILSTLFLEPCTGYSPLEVTGEVYILSTLYL